MNMINAWVAFQVFARNLRMEIEGYAEVLALTGIRESSGRQIYMQSIIGAVQMS